MTLYGIIMIFKRYFLLGAVCAAIFFAARLIVHYIKYRQVLKGENPLLVKKMLIESAIVCYILTVAGAVFLYRGDGFTGMMNLHPFYSYLAAWNRFSSFEWMNLILNIAMFIPMGILLPLRFNVFKRVQVMLPAGLAATLMIECVQYITGRGVFDFDDIFNNFLGVLIGYGIFMAVSAIKNEKPHPLRITAYLSPLIVTIVAFSTIFAVYNMKDFGNLPGYIYRQNMKDIKLSNRVVLNTEADEAPVYAVKNGSRKEMDAFAEAFFNNLGAKIDPEQTYVYDTSSYFYTEDRKLFLYVDYKDFTYSFSDYTIHNDDISPDESANEQEIRALLAGYGIDIPIGAEFYTDGGDYYFTADMLESGNKIVTGTLRCSYYDDGTIKHITNSLFELKAAKNCKIISENDAYKQIEAGRFTNPLYENIVSIDILSVSLDYRTDSKGFYQPVYIFEAEVNGKNTRISIPALK